MARSCYPLASKDDPVSHTYSRLELSARDDFIHLMQGFCFFVFCFFFGNLRKHFACQKLLWEGCLGGAVS